MNFYVNSQGQIIRVDPEDVFQGSVNANTINFVGAFPSTCPVTVAFRLPTGVWTTPASMGMNSDSPLPGVQQPDGTQFNIWRYTIPGTVTEYYGTVNLQFYVYAQGGSGSGNVLATASSSFEVKRGVPVTLPEPTDDYTTLLTQILSALQQLQQADSEGALAAQQSATAAAASATQAEQSATNAQSAQTAAETAQEAAETAQAAAEAAQTGAEEAEQNAQTLVDNAQDIAETTASGIVNNLLQNGGTFEGPLVASDEFSAINGIKTTGIYTGPFNSNTTTQVNPRTYYTNTMIIQYAANNQVYQQFFPSKSGTFVMDDDLEAAVEALEEADTNLANNKLDKTGGTVDGNLIITGNITVQGTTNINDTETLQVKDNFIVTNSDGATLAGYSGILIRTNSTVTYGITYDPVSNAVLLGQGVYNAGNGTFSFNSGEGLPVAIRAVSTSWTTGHIAVWDSTNNQFVDSGKSLSDLQEALTFDNAPTQGSNNPVTSGGIYTALQSYVTSESLTTILLSYATLSGNNTFTGNNTFDSPITVPGFANGTYSYTLPNESGTIAITSDIPDLDNYGENIDIINSATGNGICVHNTNNTSPYTKYKYNKIETYGNSNALQYTLNIPNKNGTISTREEIDEAITNILNSENAWTKENKFGKNLDVTGQINIHDSDTSIERDGTLIVAGSMVYLQNYKINEYYYAASLNNSQYNVDENIIGSVDYFIDGIYLTPLTEDKTELDHEKGYLLKFPNKGGTLALTSDITTALTPVQESVSSLQQSVSALQTQTGDLSQSVNDIYTILQQEVYTSQDITQEYSSRETADGADIIDGALATLKTVQGATVKTTNLIPFPYEGTTTTVNGVTFTNNNNGSVTINGTATGIVTFTFCTDADKMNLLAGTTYYFTCAHSILAYTDTDGIHYISAGSSFTWGTGWTFVSIYIQLNTGESETNLTVYPMLNEGSSALPYMPYFSGLKNAYFQGLRSTGRNLIPFPYSENTKTINGVTFTVNDDGTVNVNGTATARSDFILSEHISVTVGDSYFLSGCPSGGSSSKFILFGYDGVNGYSDLGVGGELVPKSNRLAVSIIVYEGVTVNNLVFKPMLNCGSTALPYEPYVANEISLDTAIELPAWDSINPTTGKRTVQSNTLTFDGTESGWFTDSQTESNIIYIIIAVPAAKDSNSLIATITKDTSSQNPGSNTGCYINVGSIYSYFVVWFRRSAYPNVVGIASAKAQLAAWNAAGNPLTVCYKTATATTTPMNATENRYTAYKGGSETVIQGTTDNSKYGAENTLTQNYAEVKGGTQS